MNTVKTLIDMASVKCGTDAELARRLGITRSRVADWKAGRDPISPETVAALCDVLQLSGEECREWVAVAIIENPKNSSRAEMLRRAFFACWVLGVGICTTAMNDAHARIVGYTKQTNEPTACTDVRRYLSLTDGLYIVARRLWSLALDATSGARAIRLGSLYRSSVKASRPAAPPLRGYGRSTPARAACGAL